MNKFFIKYFTLFSICSALASCAVPKAAQAPTNQSLPITFNGNTDTTSMALIQWKTFFNDEKLNAFIDTAIHNNLDVLMTLQELEIAKSKIRFASGRLTPFVTAGAGTSLEKVGRYTSQGAGDASADITPGQIVPENLTDLRLGFQAGWEADIWGKLKNAKQSAIASYLSTVEGKKWVTTNLIAEVANTYYELVALHAQLNIVKETIQLQEKQLEVVKAQKEASVVTDVAVKQFQAMVLNAENLSFNIKQNITEAENKLNLLLGRFPQSIQVTEDFNTPLPQTLAMGVPSQLLHNRPDIQQAEYALKAAQFDVKSAAAEFYPSINIGGSLGLNAFKSKYLFRSPESIMYSLLADVAGPVINKSAIKAAFSTANALQIEAVYQYQKTVLNGFVEVANQINNVQNLQASYLLKSKEAALLNSAIDVSADLLKFAKANYLEVLTAQKEAIATKLELIEIKKQQYNAISNLYKSLGGGW